MLIWGASVNLVEPILYLVAVAEKKLSKKDFDSIQINTLKDSELKDYIGYLASPKRIFWNNFLAGTARGLGFIFGTVVVFAIVAFIISQILTEIPWIGELFRRLDLWLSQNLDTYSQAEIN